MQNKRYGRLTESGRLKMIESGRRMRGIKKSEEHKLRISNSLKLVWSGRTAKERKEVAALFLPYMCDMSDEARSRRSAAMRKAWETRRKKKGVTSACRSN